MKSSCNVLPAGSNAAATWQPVEFDVPTGSVLDVRAEDLVTLFQLDLTRKPKTTVSSLRPVEDQARLSLADWNPEELVWTPPFAEQDWAEFTDLVPEQEHEPAPTASAVVMTEEIQAAMTDAAGIVAQARQKADEILAEARDAALTSNQQSFDEYQRAKEDGFRQGWARAEADAASVLAAAKDIVLQFTSWRDGLFAQSEPMLVEMVKQFGRAMFSEGLVLDPKALEINLNRVVENAKSLGDLKIYLNPKDADHLDPAWREYQQLISGNRIQIIPSDGIKPGGSFVQGQMGTVDARVETQLKGVLDVFTSDEPTETP